MYVSICLALAAFASAEFEQFEVDTRRVDGESWRDVASAQVPLGVFEPVDLAWADGAAFAREVSLFGRATPLTWIVGESSGEALWVDIDGDGQPDEGELIDVAFDEQALFRQMVSLDRFGLPVELLLYESGDERKATALTLYHLEVEVDLGAKPVRVLFVDMDLSGSASAGDQWIALDRSLAEVVSLPSMYFESRLTNEPCYFGERVLRPASFAPNGRVRLALGPQEQPRHEFMAERAARINAKWIASYDEDREAFCERYGIDPERPQDPSPPAWYYARDVDEARAVAEAAGKPLFVEFTSDGCGWCKRNDWMNFRDAEVTEHLRRFTLVKINRDIDPRQSAEALGLDGVPSYAVLDADGASPFTSFGWRKPSAFVDVLVEALEAVSRTP